VLPPLVRARMNATDLTLTDSYWQGSGGRGDITITVRNAGTAPASAQLTFTLPAGVRDAGSGCAAEADGGRSCTATVSGDGTWRLRVPVTVDPDAWRRAPLRGAASVTLSTLAGSVRDSASTGFSVALPPGPPASAVSVSAADVQLAADTGAGSLPVRVANTGQVPAATAVELRAPDGVQLAAPADCTGQRQVTPQVVRCDLGRLDPGQSRTVTFPLTLGAALRGAAAAPGAVTLTGAAHAFATPTGQDTAESHATYRIAVAATGTSPGASASASASASATTPPATPELEPRAAFPAVGGGTDRPSRASLSGRRLAVLPIVGTVVGLVTVFGALGVLSLRRRLRDDPGHPATE
jgi:hypothetical protein